MSEVAWEEKDWRCPKCGALDSEGTCRCLPIGLIDRLIKEIAEEEKKKHEDIDIDR